MDFSYANMVLFPVWLVVTPTASLTSPPPSSTCKNTFIVKDFVAYNILKITYQEAFYGVAFLAQSPSSHVYPAGQAEQAGPDL